MAWEGMIRFVTLKNGKIGGELVWIWENGGRWTLPFRFGELSLKIQNHVASGVLHSAFMDDEYLASPTEYIKWFDMYRKCMDSYYENKVISEDLLTEMADTLKTVTLFPFPDHTYAYKAPTLRALLFLELMECAKAQQKIKKCAYCGHYFFHRSRKIDNKDKCSMCKAPSKIYGSDEYSSIKHSIYVKGKRDGKNKLEIERMLWIDPRLKNAPSKYKKLRKYTKG